MKVIIVDDEKYIRQELRYYVEMFDDIEICGETGAADEVIPMIKKYTPDVIFLDIDLQRDSGIIIARKLLKLNKPPLIIFVTAYTKHAVEGFDIGATDYIVKPIMEERFTKCIHRVRSKTDAIPSKKKDPLAKDLNKVGVKKEDKIYLLDFDQIIYLEYINKQIRVFTKTDEYSINDSLKHFIKESPNNFIRTHKSFVVNSSYIKEIIPWFNYRYQLKMKFRDTVEIPVSRSYIKAFKKTFNL